MLQQTMRSFLGIQPQPSTLRERVVSAIGGFVGIFLVTLVSFLAVDKPDAPFVVASMGAAAVLVFAVPHGPLSQPWPVFGGNIISAFVGVTCYQFIPNVFVAAGCAVGFAIAAMHLFGCLHPPGGASALIAVVGGPSIHAMGYAYVIVPVALNVVIIFAVALIVNKLCCWRHYPAAIQTNQERNMRHLASTFMVQSGLPQGGRALALKQLASAESISADELALLVAIVAKHTPQPIAYSIDVVPKKRPLAYPVTLTITEKMH